MNAYNMTKTGAALYEVSVIVDILKSLGQAANDRPENVSFTSVDFLARLLDERIDLLVDADAAGAAA